MRVEQLGTGEPEYVVIGSIHGDEPCGMQAVERLLSEDPDVEKPVALVVANEEALAAGERYLEEDLNRAFPGNPEGDTHESRLAATIDEQFGDYTALSLHSTQSYGKPFAIVDRVTDYARHVCPRLGVEAVVDAGTETDGRLFESIPQTIEVECGYQGSDTAAANATRVARAFLRAVGVLPESERPPADGLPLFRLRDPIPKAAASKYEVYADNFTEVPAGTPFAAADGVDVVAEEGFYPVLLSPEGYEHVYGYAADRVGTLP
jgi:predicted deacylase